MDRIIVISPEELERSRSLTVDQRLRQANAALRLYTALHGTPPIPGAVSAVDRSEPGHPEESHHPEPR